MPEPVLFLQNVSVAYGTATVLDGVTSQVTAGEVVAVLGANGSGKSTLIRAALGLTPLSNGEISLFGKPISNPAKVALDRVGYLPQRATTFAETPTTALEVVMSGLIGSWRLRPARGAKARALEALAQVNLADRANHPIRFFSGGQLQRALIARALVRNPDLVFLDEPLSGIDQESQSLLLASLRQLQRDGATIVVVLHEIGLFADFLHRSIMLSEGRISYDGPPVPPTPPAEAVNSRSGQYDTGSDPCHHPATPGSQPPPNTLAPNLSWG